MTPIEERLELRINKLILFLDELSQAIKFGEESNTIKISPLAGIFERAELLELKTIRGDKIG